MRREGVGGLTELLVLPAHAPSNEPSDPKQKECRPSGWGAAHICMSPWSAAQTITVLSVMPAASTASTYSPTMSSYWSNTAMSLLARKDRQGQPAGGRPGVWITSAIMA